MQKFEDLQSYEKKLIEISKSLGSKKLNSPYSGENIRTLWNRISLLKKDIKEMNPKFNFSEVGPRTAERPKSEKPAKTAEVEVKKVEAEKVEEKTVRADSIQHKFVTTYEKIKKGDNIVQKLDKEIKVSQKSVSDLIKRRDDYIEQINKEIDAAKELLKKLEDNLEEAKKGINIYKELYDLFDTDNLRALRKRKTTVLSAKDKKTQDVLNELENDSEGKKLIEFLKKSDGIAENAQYRERAENRETIEIPAMFSPKGVELIIKDFKAGDFKKKAKSDLRKFANMQIAIEIALALRRNEIEKIRFDPKNNQLGSTKNKEGKEDKMWDAKSFIKNTKRVLRIAAYLQEMIKKDEELFRNAYKDRVKEIFGEKGFTDFSRLRRVGGTYSAEKFLKGIDAKSLANSSKLHDLQQAMRHEKNSSITSVYMNKVRLI